MSISRDFMIRNPSVPELQSATTSNPGSAWSSRATLSRNNAWSSMRRSGYSLRKSYSSDDFFLVNTLLKLTAKQQPSARGSNLRSPPKLRRIARETYKTQASRIGSLLEGLE